jgi:Mg-chelatase subunit ChlD
VKFISAAKTILTLLLLSLILISCSDTVATEIISPGDYGDDYPYGYDDDDDDDDGISPEDMASLLALGELIPPELIRIEESIHLLDQGLDDVGTGFLLGDSWRLLHYTGETGDYMIAQYGLRASKIADNQRQPLNAAVVIDHSGSMDYDRKMEFAREAAKNFIGHLGSDDIVSLIIFDKYSQTIFEAITGAEAKDRAPEIDNIVPDGATNIELALSEGYAALAGAHTATTRDYMLLVTDGQPTAGEMDSATLESLALTGCGDQVTVSTMGIGSDAEAALLEAIATGCNGRYRLIDSVSDIQDAFIEEAAAQIQAAATDVFARLATSGGLPAFDLIGYDSQSITDNLLNMSFHNLGSEAERVVILQWPYTEVESYATGVSAAVLAGVTEYNHGDTGLAANTSAEADFDDLVVTGESAALLQRNVALAHMLEAFITVGTRVVTEESAATMDDFELLNDVIDEMNAAAALAPNTTDDLFTSFVELGTAYQHVLEDYLFE